MSVDADTLVVQTSSGQQVTRVGFCEGDGPSMSSGHGFEVGRINDAINGQMVLVRDENGRPL